MTVQSAASRNSYVAAAGQTTFPYSWMTLLSTDLSVYDNSALVATSAYSVTNVGAAAGGNVVFTTAPGATHVVIIVSNAAYTQGLDLVENDPLPPESVEDALDRTTILAKQLKEITDRAPKFDVFACDSGIALNSVIGQAGKVLSVAAGAARLEWISVSQAQAAATGSFTNACGSAVSRTVTAKLSDWPTVSVKDYGAVGNGVADDRGAFDLAVAALPTTGGVLLIPSGTYRTSNAAALLQITDKSPVEILGEGAGNTFLKQEGAGDVIELIGNTELVNMNIHDLTVDGTNGNTATKGIDTLNMKDSVIERVAITGCRDHAIDFRGANQLHNTVRNGCRIGSATNGNTTGRCVNAALGNAVRIENNYFNVGGNDANHYAIAVEMGTPELISIGNIFDGVGTAIKSATKILSVGDRFDFTSPAPGAITTAIHETTNSAVVLVAPYGLTNLDTQCNFSAIDMRWVTILGHDSTSPLQGTSRISGQDISGCGTTFVVAPKVPASTGSPQSCGLYSQSTLKAFVVFDGTNTNPITPALSFNIRDARVTKPATGNFCVTFETAFTCARYTLSGSASDDGSGATLVPAIVTMNAGCCLFTFRDFSGVLTNRTIMSVTFHGTTV